MDQIVKSVPSSCVESSQVSPEEWTMRVDLAAAHRLAEIERWTDDYKVFNHFTARVPGETEHFLIKQHGLLFSEVSASNLLKLDLDGNVVGFTQNINPAGFAIHTAVLRARPDVNAVLHLHSKPGLALAALECGLRFFNQEAMRFYNRVSYHDFAGIAEVEEREEIARHLGTNPVMILRNHGLLVCSSSIRSATFWLGNLIAVAEAQLKILATGEKLLEPSAEICAKTAKQYDTPAAQGNLDAEWGALLRFLDKRDASYRH